MTTTLACSMYGVEPEPRAGGREIAQRPVPGDVGEAVVGAARQDDVDLHAAPRRQRQRHQQGRVGNEVRRDDEHAPLRHEAAREQQRLHRVVDLLRAARHELRERRVAGGDDRYGAGAGDDAACAASHRPSPSRTARQAWTTSSPRRSKLRSCQAWLRALPGELAGSPSKYSAAKLRPAAPEPLAVGDEHLAVVAQVGAAAQDRAERRHELHDLRRRSGCSAFMSSRPPSQAPMPSISRRT